MAYQILNSFNNEINLNTSDGSKLFKEGIKPLDKEYDGSAEKAICIFIERSLMHPNHDAGQQ